MADYSVLVVPLVTVAALSLVLAYLVWRMNRISIRSWFALMLLAMCLLSFSYILELATTTLGEKSFWNALEYVSTISMPPIFVVFAIKYARSGVSRRRWAIPALFFLPVVFIAFRYTNSWHHLFLSELTLPSDPAMSPLQSNPGPVYVAFVGYSLVMVLLGASILLNSYLSSSRLARRRTLLIIMAMFLPLLAYISGFLRIYPLTSTFLTALSYMVGTLLIFWGIFRYAFFDMTPLAMETIVETMGDGIIAIDLQEKVLHLNPEAERMVNVELKGALGKPARSVLPKELIDAYLAPDNGHEAVEVRLGKDACARTFSVKRSSIQVLEGVPSGCLLQLRDITHEMEMSKDLQRANVKLNLLYNLTRQDVLNQLVVIRGAGEIALGKDLSEEQAHWLHRIVDSASNIERTVQLSREYQNLGTKAPEWRSLRQAVALAKTMPPVEQLPVVLDISEAEVFADPLLDKVFYILLSNSYRHGKKVTSIRISAHGEGSTGSIVYEDDGVGIPHEDKERVFEPGYGRDLGLGLTLAKEILAITAIDIREEGEPGRGTRFVMRVPKGNWREAGR